MSIEPVEPRATVTIANVPRTEAWNAIWRRLFAVAPTEVPQETAVSAPTDDATPLASRKRRRKAA